MSAVAIAIVLLVLAVIVLVGGVAMGVAELRAIRRLLAGQAAHERVIDDGGI